MTTYPDHGSIRELFPALKTDTVFLENAGGSQVPLMVADAMRDYMLTSYVQLGAGYALSDQSTGTVDRAHDFVNLLMNGTATGSVALASSCSVLCRMLADCYAAILTPGDEVVIAETAHEANAGPWAALERQGIAVRVWKMNPLTFNCELDELDALLSPRTRIVAFPHVSNLLGDIVDIESIVSMAHRAGARVIVDGVAYAPHRAMDVAAWDVDWYVYSTYKVYGPHMAALYGRADAFAELTGPNHYFIPDDEVPYKFELGGAIHEGCAGLLALGKYLAFLSGRDEVDRGTVTSAFEQMTCCELPLQERLISWLLEHPRIRIVGPDAVGRSRVGTISFLHERLSSAEIAGAAHRRNIAIRNGHMYAHRLCRALDIDPGDGVVRVSLVHYNTLDEIEQLIEVLGEIL